MKTSPSGIALIRHFESCKLEAYRCPAGVWTIGWGHTAGVSQGLQIDQAHADQLLASDLAAVESSVSAMTRCPLSQSQFDACVSLVFNIGVGAFRSSTLLALLNQGEYSRAALQFGRWVRAGDEVLPGLVTRRAAEQAMFSGKALSPA